jgi:hypothetical protein
LASELCQTVGDEFFFFTLHSFLEVGKTQDLPSKFWQTLGDALNSFLSGHGCLYFVWYLFGLSPE